MEYPHVLFTNVSSNLHLQPFIGEGRQKQVASYAIRRGSVIETGPFFLNHRTVAHLLYLGIGVELFKNAHTSIKLESMDDLIKIAVFDSVR